MNHKLSLVSLFVIFFFLQTIIAWETCGANNQYICGDDSDPKTTNDSVCHTWRYLYDENIDSQGKSKCTTDCQCDGERRCVDSCCSGWPRVASDVGEENNDCLNPTYQYDEDDNILGCDTACDCDGNRFCDSNGTCEGTARFADLCLSAGIMVTQQQATDIVQKDQDSSCSCQTLLGKAFDYIMTKYLGNQNEDACTSFVNDIENIAINSVCDDSAFCGFCLGTITDQAASVIPFKSPFVNLCISMLNVLQDFTGININDMKNQTESALTSAFQNAAGVACGTIICSDDCQNQDLNGASLPSVAVDATCAAISSFGLSVSDLNVSSQLSTLVGLIFIFNTLVF